jgi:hypothetical protein
LLPPVPAAQSDWCDPAPDDRFDAFATIQHDNRWLAPWHTAAIPFGSDGNPATWDPQLLTATTIQRYRKRLLQRAELSGGWIPQPSDDSLGNSFASVSAMTAIPIGSEKLVVAAIPRFRTDWLEGPQSIDVPPRLYSATVDVGLRWLLTDQLTFTGGFQPGWFSDAQASHQAFRLGGLLLLSYDLVPGELTLSGGIARLDRNDYDLIPAAGLTWTPSPDLRFDLNFPKPRIARRVGHVPFLLEDWVYVGASLGGGSWAVERVTGIDDELTLLDYRVVLGLERLVDGGSGVNVEAGYVFGRRLEYESSPHRHLFDDSWIVEAGLRF